MIIIIIIMFQNSVLYVWKLSAYVYQIEILENVVFFKNLDLKNRILLPLDSLRRQMSSAVVLMYYNLHLINDWLDFDSFTRQNSVLI
jgi:hypothetical protein